MAERLDGLRARQPAMVRELSDLVEAESPSGDLWALAHCAGVLATIGTGLLGVEPERIVVEGHTHLLWQFGTGTDVLLLGHLDTVWPLGTLAGWPFTVDGDIATGPGAFDMKAGLVQGCTPCPCWTRSTAWPSWSHQTRRRDRRRPVPSSSRWLPVPAPHSCSNPAPAAR